MKSHTKTKAFASFFSLLVAFPALVLILSLTLASPLPVQADDTGSTGGSTVSGTTQASGQGGYTNINGTFTNSGQLGNSGNQNGSYLQQLLGGGFAGGNLQYTFLAPLGSFSNCGKSGINGQQNCTIDVQNGLKGYLDSLFTMGIAIATGLALFVIVFAGVKYVSSDAINSKNEGKEMIQNALSGLLLAFCSYILLNTINPQLVSDDLNSQVQNIDTTTNITASGLQALSASGSGSGAAAAGNWGAGSSAITSSITSQISYLTGQMNDAQAQLDQSEISQEEEDALKATIVANQQQILQLNAYLAQGITGDSSGGPAGSSPADFKLSTNADGSITAVPGHVALDFDGPSKAVTYSYVDPSTGETKTVDTPIDDPSWQPTTSPLPDGTKLDGGKDNFVVTPLGSNIPKGWVADVTNTATGQTIYNVPIGDRGPTSNGYGEISGQLALNLHVWTPADGNTVAGNPVLTYNYHPPK